MWHTLGQTCCFPLWLTGLWWTGSKTWRPRVWVSNTWLIWCSTTAHAKSIQWSYHSTPFFRTFVLGQIQSGSGSCCCYETCLATSFQQFHVFDPKSKGCMILFCLEKTFGTPFRKLAFWYKVDNSNDSSKLSVVCIGPGLSFSVLWYLWSKGCSCAAAAWPGW